MSDKIFHSAILSSSTTNQSSIKMILSDYKSDVPSLTLISKKSFFECHFECVLRIRLDKSEPIEVNASQCASCYETLKIDSYLIYLMRNSKEILIEVPIHRNRVEIYKFKIEGFDTLSGKSRSDWKWD